MTLTWSRYPADDFLEVMKIIEIKVNGYWAIVPLTKEFGEWAKTFLDVAVKSALKEE